MASGPTACGQRRQLPSSRCGDSSSPCDGLQDRSRSSRRSAVGRSGRRGAPGAGHNRPAGLHLPRPKRLPLRGVAGSADVPGALGNRPGPARPERGTTSTGSFGAGCTRLYHAPAPEAPTSIASSTRQEKHHRRVPVPGRPLLVVPAGNGAAAAPASGALVSPERVYRRTRPGPAPEPKTGMPAWSAALPAVATAIPIGSTSPCTPTASTGYRISAPDRMSRGISFGIARPWRTTPILDGRSQSMGDAVCDDFAVNGDWAWARGSSR